MRRRRRGTQVRTASSLVAVPQVAGCCALGVLPAWRIACRHGRTCRAALGWACANSRSVALGCLLLLLSSGAEVVGDDDLIARILESGGGGLQFDKCIATPDMMPRLSKVGARGVVWV